MGVRTNNINVNTPKDLERIVSSGRGNFQVITVSKKYISNNDER